MINPTKQDWYSQQNIVQKAQSLGLAKTIFLSRYQNFWVIIFFFKLYGKK